MVRPQEHALVQQHPERLLEIHHPGVVHHLGPEPRVEQVHHGVLGPADVEVHREPVPDGLGIEGPIGVFRRGEPQEVPGRAGEPGHRVGVAQRIPAAVRALRADPRVRPGEGRASGLVGLVALHVREGHGEIAVGHDAAGRAVDHRDGGAPVPLTAHQPVADPVPHRLASVALLLGAGSHGLPCRRGIEAGERTAVHQHAIGDRGSLLDPPRHTTGCDDLADGYPELAREGVVPLVMGGDGHDRRGAVSGQDVVRNPDRDAFAAERIDGRRAGEDPRLIPFGCEGSLAISPGAGELGVVPDGLEPVRGAEPLQIRMLRGYHAEGRPVDRVQPGRVNR